MKKDELFKKVSALGFPLMDVEDEQHANKTLADMVKSGDLRLWEGFPIVLANSTEKGLFTYDAVRSTLKQSSERSHFHELMLMSLALYRFFGKSLSWSDAFHHSLSDTDKKKLDGFYEKLKNDTDFSLGGHIVSVERLKATFQNYMSETQADLQELISVKDELGLEYALSQVFSPKQKELFLKKLKREKLTKTEKEYFSRVVKKKLLALANPELHRLSQKVLQ